MPRIDSCDRPADDVVEIWAHTSGGLILSHINYGHLKRVRTARTRLVWMRAVADARNDLVAVENLPDARLDQLKHEYAAVAQHSVKQLDDA